jgi:hypothetical protein
VLLPPWRDEPFPFLIETLGIKTTMAYHLVISDDFGQSEIKENYAHPNPVVGYFEFEIPFFS